MAAVNILASMLGPYLVDLGISTSGSLLANTISYYMKKTKNPDVNGLLREISSSIEVNNANIESRKIIDFLVKKGVLEIKGTRIYTNEEIKIKSNEGGSFYFGDGSISQTERGSLISAGRESSIKGKGKAEIRQKKDGSILFNVG